MLFHLVKVVGKLALANSPLFIFVVLNYNGRKHLANVLPTLCRLKYSNFKTIVVDNGSIDDSVSFIKLNFPEIIGIWGKAKLRLCQRKQYWNRTCKRTKSRFYNFT